MKRPVFRLGTLESAVCACCRREADGGGYIPPSTWSERERGIRTWDREGRALWSCDFYESHSGDPVATCFHQLQRIYGMSDRQFTAHEEKALREAAELGGSYLDEIGTTYVALLSEEQYLEFVRRLLRAQEDSLKRQFRNGELPW